MFGYVKFLWPLIAGICLYAGVMHLQIGLRRPMDRVHTLFGALALCMALGIFGNILLTTAQTPADYQWAAWYSSITATLVFVALPWFVTFYADEPGHGAAASLSGFFAVVLLGTFFHPYSMLLSAPPELVQVTLPWGEQLTRTTTPATAWLNLIWLGYGLTVVYLMYVGVGVFKRGPRVRAWGLLLSAGPFALSLCINLLVNFGFLNLPYVAAPGFLAMVTIMSAALTREWRRSHAQMQTVLDNVPAAVYLKKVDGRYAFVNRQFERLYNLPAAAILGKTDVQIFPAAQAALHTNADKATLTEPTVESEETMDRIGESRTYACVRFALRDSGGGAYAICGIATDITHRKVAADVLRNLAATLERRVARRTSELAQLNHELEAFAYSVSHDLRAPLTAVNGFAELLLREHGPKLDQNGQRYIQRIRDGSLRMGSLIQDLLGLSRVAQQTLRRTPIDLVPLLVESLKHLRESDPVRVVTVNLPTSLPANGDASLLGLALDNLLDNAWKYTAKTEHARIDVGTLERNGETVYCIKDNGAGFDPQYADRLFRPFVRLHSEQEFPGTGIGLATVARIVSRHGGRVWAESALGQGATFFFTLPIPEEELSASESAHAVTKP